MDDFASFRLASYVPSIPSHTSHLSPAPQTFHLLARHRNLIPAWLWKKTAYPSVYNLYLVPAITVLRLTSTTQSIGITMFRFSVFLGMFLLLLQTQNACAANIVIWKNHCDYDLYFWTVGPNTPERDDAFTRVPAHGENVHPMRWHEHGGFSLKYRDLPYYTRGPAGILQAEYNMDRVAGKLFYDSSIIDCGRDLGPQNPFYCPFAHGGVNMYIVGNRGESYLCKDSSCQLGGHCDNATYLVQGGWKNEPSLSCPLGVDLVFETCTERSAEKTWVEGQVGPAPVPAPWQPPPAPVYPPLPPPASPWTPQDRPMRTALFPTVTTRPTQPSPPKTYPVPQGHPEEAVCFDADCRCYGFWGIGQPGRADCTGFEGVVECYFFQMCETWQQTERRRWGRQ
ncbi:hypothetical protein P171DRAFT_520941 [Karstenula rhodostoma CBS 690.94]|uniref:Uncharacterized protein n=1 Tax=Karstenula rhodostoma CBS 690.94 TaxID=1392251 RepID=A0A9P4PKH1_9PLEO|nr:hypothetical protein P171DRAFT_520941 [Karstenula rhodostoma CBS 690.94]